MKLFVRQISTDKQLVWTNEHLYFVL